LGTAAASHVPLQPHGKCTDRVLRRRAFAHISFALAGGAETTQAGGYPWPMMTSLSVGLVAFLLATFSSESRARLATDARVTYVVGLERRGEQLVDIEMRVRDWAEPTMQVHMPIWRPGRYEVLESAGSVRQLEAVDASGAALPVEKTEKATWTITTRARGDVTIRYRLYANSIANRTRHVDDTHAFLSGASVFLYCHERRNDPLTVTLRLPEGWRIACGLDADPTEASTLAASDYDQLVDSPIEAGIHTTRTLEIEGTPHEFVFWGRTDAVPEGFYEEAAKIVRAQHALFVSFPHRRYVFMTHIAPGLGGGTEHVNSTIMQAKPTVFDSAKDRRNFLALLSHEFFHTWNVKQFRPEGLKPYRYQRENYTKLLWVAEGTTSYYDELLCVRAGSWKPSQYLESLGKLIEEETTRPGATVQSLESSSFDSWIKFNRPTPDGVNSTVSFYSKGALVSFLLDASIRRDTANGKTLDDLMRLLYQRFPLASPGSYTTADLLAMLRELTGADYAPFFAKYVAGTDPIDATEAMATFGLEWKSEEGEADDEKPSRAWLGIDVRDADGTAQVSSVRSDGPGAAAGLMVDDQLVALDGIRLRAGEMDGRLKRLQPGAKATLTFFRRDLLRSVELTAGEKPVQGRKLVRVKEPTTAQRAAYEQWLGQPWEPKDGDRAASVRVE